MARKILITGSNGLLGQKLVELVTTQPGYEVIATARGANRLKGDFPDFTYRELDITNREDVYNILEQTRPHYVIHTAAMTNVDQCESEREECRKLNVDAVSYLAEACNELGIFLLHLSTDFIFDGEAGPYAEEAKANPLSFYGHSKADAEQILFESRGLKWAIARTVLVYGIAQDMSRSNIILWVKKSLEEGKKINVVDDQWRTPTLAEDLAKGCFLICDKDATGIFNISGRDFLTPYEMAIATANYFGLDTGLITKVDGSIFTQPAARPPRTGFIIDKAVSQLGYDPVSFDEGIAILARQVEQYA